MKQQWTAQELIDHWTFTQEEIALIQNIGQTDYNRLGYGLLLRYFQREGKFPPRKQDIPAVIVGHIAQQLHIQEGAFDFYKWTGRTMMRHRVHIRKLLGFRIGTIADAARIITWLSTQALIGENRQFDRLKEVVRVSPVFLRTYTLRNQA